MEFEYDPNKSAGNLTKHGVDFDHAQRLWDDPDLLDIRLNYPTEERWLSIGVMDGKHWSAIWTPRGDRIRIISVRRSRTKEVEAYEHQD